MKRRTYYLLKIQYLGFRYSGWQKQPGQKTVEGMMLKTLKFILPDRQLKILGSSRTDAKVSAHGTSIELFIDGYPLENLNDFMELLNANLPADIRILEISEVDKKLNIIQDVLWKEYRYLFSFGSKNHPYAAPFMANILETLDIHAMQEAVSLFEGTHHFKCYTPKSQHHKDMLRTIEPCKIQENTFLKADFFPENSYCLYIKGKGFLRYQVRMIMGALVELGKGVLSKDQIRESLNENSKLQLSYVAPGSGLHLYDMALKD